ncbi:MAG: hydrogenase small subunit [Trueperaceae bacterium]|nr:hydrogenase small subunit [Trueperaceae bacterium]
MNEQRTSAAQVPNRGGIDRDAREHYARLAEEADRNLDRLAAMPVLKDATLESALKRQGISRREFLKLTAVTTAALSLPSLFDTRVARAAELMNRLPVLWMELQSCTGNSMALIRNSNPGVDTLLLDLISLEYSEVLMAASGQNAEDVLAAAIEKYDGQYIAVFEGSVPLEANGSFLTIGPAGETGIEKVEHVAKHAAAVIAAGTCASYGGIPAAAPNPTGALGVADFLNSRRMNVPVVNLPACPVSSTNVVGTILEYALFGRLPSLDAFGRPLWAYQDRIHDKCERRGHFDAGEFVEGWSDIEGVKSGLCLFKVGCKGPMTYNNCGVVRYNDGASWPIMSGHGCIGCSEPGFWDTMTPFEVPVAGRQVRMPFGNDATADTIGAVAVGAAAAGVVVHAAATVIKAATEKTPAKSESKPTKEQ